MREGRNKKSKHPRALKFLLPPLCFWFSFLGLCLDVISSSALTLNSELPFPSSLSLLVEGFLNLFGEREKKKKAKPFPRPPSLSIGFISLYNLVAQRILTIWKCRYM